MRLINALLIAIFCVLTLATGFSQSAVVLISDDEAKLPPPKGAAPIDSRGVTRGPKIVLVAPEGAFRPPAALKLTFQSYGGSAIDVGSLRVLYLRTPDVDITARFKPFVSPAGIDLPAAIIPPGEHQLRFDIKDAGGRETTKIVVLKTEM